MRYRNHKWHGALQKTSWGRKQLGRARGKFRKFTRKNTRSFGRVRRGRISGFKAHKFVDRTQQASYYLLATSTTSWNTLSANTQSREISADVVDKFVYFRPNIQQSILFTAAVNQYTHFKFHKWTININPMSTLNFNPQGGMSEGTASYQLFSKQYPFNNIPANNSVPLATGLTTYAQCLDNPTFSKRPMHKRLTLTLRPWTWTSLETAQGALINTFVPVLTNVSKKRFNIADYQSLWYHGCIWVIESIPAGSTAFKWTLENAYFFTLFNPY
jgi:hypothetical protein